VLERVVPTDGDPRIATTAQVFVGIDGPRLGIARKPLLDPLLAALAHHRPLAAAIALDSADQGEALLAHAWLPALAGLVALQIRRLRESKGRADPGDDSILDVGVEQAVVGVVGGTEKGERR